MHRLWVQLINALTGSLVVTVGAWLAWNELSPIGGGIIFAVATGFLAWRGKTVATIWA
jgi:hypothetical protein